MGELMEKLKQVGDFFKNAIEMLHGVGSPIKICLLGGVFAIAVVWTLVAGVLEVIKKAKEKHEGLVIMETKHPKLFAFLYSGKVRFFLLTVVILLFAIDWRDATTISPPIVKAPPAPIVQFGVPNRSGPDKAGISFVQNSMIPQAIQQPWQKAKNYDKPGVSTILTASGEIRHPLFIFKCNIPCIFTDGNGISTAFLAHLVKDKSTDVRIVMQLDIPAKLIDGQQLEMQFRSQSDKDVKIETVQLMQP